MHVFFGSDWCLRCLVLLASFIDNLADKCKSLDGRWYNQLGSIMELKHSADGQLTGDYISSVEREEGSRGGSHAQAVMGAAPYDKPGAVFGFAVMFNRGASTVAWTGQCLSCGEDEVLETSWLLREFVDSCKNKWMATRIGQDTFTRYPQDVHVSGRQAPKGESPNSSKGKVQSSGPTRVARSAPWEPVCALQGAWYNDLGSEMILRHLPNNSLQGEYRTAVERHSGAAGTSHSKVYGVGNVYLLNTTMAIFVVWQEGESITGWVGQCHLCGPSSDAQQLLEVTYLLRKRIISCDDNWKSTLYGQNTFTRHEQKNGPRGYLGVHTPGQEGEVEPLLQQQNTCRASLAQASSLLLTLVTLHLM